MDNLILAQKEDNIQPSVLLSRGAGSSTTLPGYGAGTLYYKCSLCGSPTEWDDELAQKLKLGKKPVCYSCWCKLADGNSRDNQVWAKKRLCAREIIRLYTTEAVSVKDLAPMFDVSERTVERILKRANVWVKRRR